MIKTSFYPMPALAHKPLALVILTMAIGLTACNDGTKTSHGNPNQAPIAHAGADFTANSNEMIYLDGSASSDKDGRIVLYTWTQTSGTSIKFADNKTSKPQFTTPQLKADETLIFNLAVKDDLGLISNDSVSVYVKGYAKPNVPPNANAGAEQTVDALSNVALAGGGNDEDGEIVDYQWEQTGGRPVTFSDARSPNPVFNAPDCQEDESLDFALTVTDDKGAKHKAHTRVHVKAPKRGLNAPSNVAADAHNPDSAVISWELVKGATKYDICLANEPIEDIESCRSYKNGAWIRGIEGDYYVITGLKTSVNTYFRVVAKDKLGTISAGSEEVSVKPQPNTALGALNDTGVTQCASTDKNDACTSNQHDFQHGRDAWANDDSNGHAGFNFTKIGAKGEPLAADATEWSCVQDNVTGLMWEVKTSADDGGLHDKNASYLWDETTEPKEVKEAQTCNNCDIQSYVPAFNDAGYCGYSDWRLPTVPELTSIVDFSYTLPAIDTDYFPDTQPYGVYATGVLSAPSKFTAPWLVQFNSGWAASADQPRGVYYHVRMVRAVATAKQ